MKDCTENKILKQFQDYFRTGYRRYGDLRPLVNYIIQHKDDMSKFYYACFLDFCVCKLSYHIYDEMDREDSPLFIEYRKCLGCADDRCLASLVEVDGFTEKEFTKYFTKANKLWREYGESAISHFIMMSM